MTNEEKKQTGSFFALPVVGSVFTVLSGLSFLILGMILPLVGRSGSDVPFARQNFLTFLGVALLALVLATMAVISKLERRKVDGSPLPYGSIGLCAICVFLLLALFAGLLRV